jgi:hypothetical protein
MHSLEALLFFPSISGFSIVSLPFLRQLEYYTTSIPLCQYLFEKFLGIFGGSSRFFTVFCGGATFYHNLLGLSSTFLKIFKLFFCFLEQAAENIRQKSKTPLQNRSQCGII